MNKYQLMFNTIFQGKTQDLKTKKYIFKLEKGIK